MRYRKIGILGGLSPESTVAYYEHITRTYTERHGDYGYPEILIYSVNFQKYVDWQHGGRWEAAAEDMAAAARRAADFWASGRDRWYERHDLPMVVADSWSLAALDALHRLGLATRRHTDYCFFLAEEILARQETPATARWPDHVGAPAEAGKAPDVGTTAACCEGLVAAWRLARRMGVPTARYRRGALLAARFVLAHQFDRVNAYLVRNPGRALGSFYSSYADLGIRMDEVQHAVSALLGVAALLEAEEP